MAEIVAGNVPEDIERCVDVCIAALRHRDGVVDTGPVAERMRRVLERPIIRFALMGESLMGFAVTAPKPGEATTAVLERIAVMPSFAGEGRGRALLRDAMLSSREAGFSTIELGVRRGNDAVRLYEGEGFAIASGVMPHPLGGEPMLTLSRHL